MTIKKTAAVVAAALIFSTLGLTRNALASGPANADELVAQHLDSIATPAVRAGLKTRVVQGPVRFNILVGGAGTLDGKAVLVSDGRKLQFMMKLPNNLYRGEQFIFDGDKDSVAYSSAQQTRSAVGSFVFVQDAVIREGLIGGTLSTAWPLLDVNDRKAKVSFEGLKKIDGQDLYALKYRPHKGTDLDILLYFDPQTYHHVQTVYSYSSSSAIPGTQNPALTGLQATPAAVGGSATGGSGSPETANARQFPNRYRLTEKFSDFKTVDGVTLPTRDNIQFSQELQNGRTTLWEWDLKGLDISNNMSVDAKNFEVK